MKPMLQKSSNSRTKLASIQVPLLLTLKERYVPAPVSCFSWEAEILVPCPVLCNVYASSKILTAAGALRLNFLVHRIGLQSVVHVVGSALHLVNRIQSVALAKCCFIRECMVSVKPTIVRCP
jgi:hypothetical protein